MDIPKLDITGYDYSLIREFVVSRYQGEATLAERMSDGPGAVDPFRNIEGIRPNLERFAEVMRDNEPGLNQHQLMRAFNGVMFRTD
jgi:hypothetical protein